MSGSKVYMQKSAFFFSAVVSSLIPKVHRFAIDWSLVIVGLVSSVGVSSPVRKRRKTETRTSESASECEKETSVQNGKVSRRSVDQKQASNKAGSKDKAPSSHGKGKQSAKAKTANHAKQPEKTVSKRKTVETTAENGFMSIWTEKRPTPSMDYNESNAKCPLPGCDSKGSQDKPSYIYVFLDIQNLKMLF